MSRAKCSWHKAEFAVFFENAGGGLWAAKRAFKRSDEGTRQQYPLKPVRLEFSVHPDYGGCPYCGNKSFFWCPDCAVLNCGGFVIPMKSGKLVAVCCQCGLGDFMGGPGEIEIWAAPEA
jgi:hypothetical protein